MGILIIVAVAAGAYFLYTQSSSPSNGGLKGLIKRPPLDIARERYARGEISRSEFQELKNDLSREN